LTFQQKIKKNLHSLFYGDGKIIEQFDPNKSSIKNFTSLYEINRSLQLTKILKKFLLTFLFIICFLNFQLLFAEDVKISSINFSGNNTIDSQALRSVLNLKSGDVFSYKQLNKKLENILILYKKRGYYFTKIAAPRVDPVKSKNRVEINIEIEEGKRVQVSKINFVGNKYFSDERLKNLIETEEDQIFSPLILNKDIATIADAYAEKGYPFCKINIADLVLDDNSISVYLQIEENKLMRISDLVFKGNKITRDKTLKLMLNFRKNEIYKQSKIEKACQNLLRKKYITLAELVPLDSRNLLVRITERSMNDFHGVLGLSPDREKSFTERLTGFVDFSFMNIFGTDREVHLLWEKLQNKSYRVDLSYNEPFLFASQTSAQLSLKRKNVDTIFVKTDAKIGINYHLPNYNQIGVSYLISNSLLDTNSTNRKGVGLNFIYDNIYHPSNPSASGYSLEAEYEIIWKSRHSYRQEIQANLQYVLPLFNKQIFF